MSSCSSDGGFRSCTDFPSVGIHRVHVISGYVEGGLNVEFRKAHKNYFLCRECDEALPCSHCQWNSTFFAQWA